MYRHTHKPPKREYMFGYSMYVCVCHLHCISCWQQENNHKSSPQTVQYIQYTMVVKCDEDFEGDKVCYNAANDKFVKHVLSSKRSVRALALSSGVGSKRTQPLLSAPCAACWTVFNTPLLLARVTTCCLSDCSSLLPTPRPR